MSTDILTRNLPNSDALHAKVSSPVHNTNPFAYENLAVSKRLTKGKFPIYLTSSKINSQTYIMKVFSNSESIQDSHEYYQNEARFASLNHPNVINIVHHQQERRLNYVLSEYAPYGDFFDFIVNHKNEIDEKLARTYFRQLIDGLEYLHFVGVAHLDLKPENLLIGADFNLKIGDFDLSYIIGDGKVLSRGTRNYRAPEVYNSSSSNAELDLPVAADIYSAGIILFLMKTGGMYPQAENRVIEGVNLTELMHKNHKKFWSKHCKLQGKEKSFFDSNFKELFHKMVKADPKKRYTIKKIKQSKWYNGPVYSPQELSMKMKAILKC